MSKVWIIRKKQLASGAAGAILLAALLYILLYKENGIEAFFADAVLQDKVRVIHMVTGEFKGKTADGKELEAYVWHPGTIYVKQGERIQLRILGVSGKSHPFIIEGMNIKGEVQQGKETVVEFTADKEGTFKLICFAHADAAHHGPMIAYIVVD